MRAYDDDVYVVGGGSGVVTVEHPEDVIERKVKGVEVPILIRGIRIDLLPLSFQLPLQLVGFNPV